MTLESSANWFLQSSLNLKQIHVESVDPDLFEGHYSINDFQSPGNDILTIHARISNFEEVFNSSEFE